MIKRRSKMGTYATLAGLAVLMAGMFASMQKEGQYLWLSMVALVVGFFLSQFGSFNLRRWSRSPRPDQVIARELKGFDDRYHLYSWALPAPHVLLTPQGVYAFETRDQQGTISVQGSTFRTKFNLGRALLFFGQESLGNPIRDAVEGAGRLDKLIRLALPDSPGQVLPAVIFVDQHLNLSVNEPQIPVMKADDIKRWIRGTGKGEMFTGQQYKALEKVLDEAAGEVVTTDGGEEEKPKAKMRARPKRQKLRGR
jgi:hypothetical protein